MAGRRALPTDANGNTLLTSVPYDQYDSDGTYNALRTSGITLGQANILGPVLNQNADSEFGANFTAGNFAILGTGNYRVNATNGYNDGDVAVIQDTAFKFTGSANIDRVTTRAQMNFVNCRFDIDNWDGTDGNRLWLFRLLNSTTGGGSAFSSGTSVRGRPEAFTSQDSDATFNFYNCDLVVSDPNSGTDVRVILGDFIDSTLIYNNDNTNGMSIYPVPNALWSNSVLSDNPNSFESSTATRTNNIWITGATAFDNVDFRGYSLNAADTSRVTLVAPTISRNGLISAFNSGNDNRSSASGNNELLNNGRGWIKVVNPIRTIDSDGSTTGDLQFTASIASTIGGGATPGNAISGTWRTEQRYIELQRLSLALTEGFDANLNPIGADNANVRLVTSHSFPAAQQQAHPDDATFTRTVGGPDDFVAFTGTQLIQTYRTDTNGSVSGVQYNPATGDSDQLTGFIDIPIAVFGTTSTVNSTQAVTMIEGVTSTVEIRSFFHAYENILTFTKSNLDVRATNLLTSGTDVAEAPSVPLDPNLRNAALFSSGTTKNTPQQLQTYTMSLFSDSDTASPQDVYETVSYLRKELNGNSFNTINNITASGTTATWTGGTITITDSDNGYSYSNNVLSFGTNGLFQSLQTEPTQAIIGLTAFNANNNSLRVQRLDATNINNPSTTVSLPISNRDTNFDLQGDFNGTINLSVDSDVFLYVNLSSSSGLTITNSGSGTVSIATQTRPDAGTTAPAITNVTLGTNVQYETVAAVDIQPTILNINTAMFATGAVWELYRGDNILFDSDWNIIDSDSSVLNGTVDGSAIVLNSNTLGESLYQDTFVLGIATKYSQTTFYRFNVTQNTATNEVGQVTYQWTPTTPVSELNNFDLTATVGSRLLTARRKAIQDSETTVSGTNIDSDTPQMVVEVDNCIYPDFSLSEETTLMFGNMRESLNYLRHARRFLGDTSSRTAFTIASNITNGVSFSFDFFSPNGRSGVVARPKTQLVFSDRQPAEAGTQTLQGLLVSNSTSQFVVPSDIRQQIDIGSLSNPDGAPEVTCMINQTTSAREIDAIRSADLDERRLTVDTMNRITGLEPKLRTAFNSVQNPIVTRPSTFGNVFEDSDGQGLS